MENHSAILNPDPSQIKSVVLGQDEIDVTKIIAVAWFDSARMEMHW